MKKFIKFKVSNDTQALIDIDKIISVNTGTGATEIDFRINTIVPDAAVANNLVLAYRITFAGMSGAQNIVAVNLIYQSIEAALQSSSSNPEYDMTSQIVPAVSGITRVELAWA